MTLDEYIQKLETAQKVLPDMLSAAAKNATIRAVEAAQEKTPPTADSLGGTNTRSGELKQHWATDSKIIPEHQDGQYVTELANNKEYASFVNDGHRMDKHFVPGLYVNPASGLLRAYDRKTDIDSDGLHYKFELRVFVDEQPDDFEKMQSLSIDQKVKK